MPAVFVLAGVGLRRRRVSLLGLAIVLALGTGVTIASLEASARTDRAYQSYLGRSEVGELVVNPSLITDRVAGIIASTPGVSSYVSDSLLTATPDRGEPRTQAAIDGDGTQVRMSADGRYVRQDRPAVRQGRMIRDGAEAFVNVEMANALGLHVGDILPLAFWPNSFNDPKLANSKAVIEPLGRAEARIVGIGVFSDEVLIDDLYPRHRVLVTPALGSPFDCTLSQPPPDDARPLDELVASLIPPGCATSYRYFSLRVEGGDGGVGSVADSLAARFAEENQRLPASLRARGVGFEITPTVRADERHRVERSLAPSVRALQLFGAAAAASTLVLGLLGAMRIARREEHDARIWRDLGVTRALRTAVIAIPLAAAAAAGLAASLVVGWLASGIGPVASARAVDRGGHLGLTGAVVLVVCGTALVAMAGGILMIARITSGTGGEPAGPAFSRLPRGVAGAAAVNPVAALGVRAATAGAGGRALMGASVAAVGAVVATLVFSASVVGLVSDPEQFGWPYDIGATVNYGYGGTTDSAAIAATLDRPEVQRWGVATLSGGLTIRGETMPYVAAGPGFEAMRLPVIDGRLPANDDEIAVGALTARRLGLHVGSKVLAKTTYGEQEATVRGIVVLPPLGPFQADRASLGTGALLSERFHQSVLREAERNAGMEPGGLANSLAGFVGVQLRPGVDAQRFLATISNELPTWDHSAALPFVYGKPVRPATVANVAAMRGIPIALAGVLALAMAIAMTLAVAVATRSRRRELAVLRALGCIGRQLRATVRWQALTVAAVGIALGIPLGLALGRVSYRGFANGLGVTPEAVVPFVWIVVLVVGTIGVALLAAAGPAHRAARLAAGETLRHE